ncbi:MAG TPA: glycosyl hydrolase 108 family protein [Thermoanaerobaculia bacterium]|nr:MAG: putative Peptidoglycan domain protein [Acidobacteria bacterium ADurb.Bin051]HQP93373.1 glycosyl hydrolase 108 family protein [Thermoanaerobaculia bacterium]
MSAEGFAEALNRTLRHEGLYSADPRDPGGETFRGIARRRHPEWPGWRRVDAVRWRPGWQAELEADGELSRLVAAFYRAQFWLPLRADELEAGAGWAVAAKLFDAAVNIGQRRAVEVYQGALVALGAAGLEVDGRIGPATLAAAGEFGAGVLPALRAGLAGYYVGLVAGAPSLAYYARGWRRRALA